MSPGSPHGPGSSKTEAVTPRPFRFGLQAFAPTTADGWIDLARQTEAAGYSTLLVSDHVYYPQFAPLPAMMAAAAATETLRVGALVLANDLRHPGLHAAELATIDALSNGRVEVGIGAGWAKADYTQLGLPHDRAGVRIARLREAIEILKLCFDGTIFDYPGEHYRLVGHTGAPVPVRRPPLLIGGGGPKMLRLAADHADIVGINGMLAGGEASADVIASMTAAKVDERLAVLTDAVTAERLAEIELNMNVYFQVFSDHRVRVAERMAAGMGLSIDELLDTPYTLIGTADEMIDTLLARRERWGISYVVVQQEHLAAFAPVVAALSGR